mmetsp:Transcript_5196/g.3900  ORF Transcript_5196/g.3900 Transcript_5196/m.3900 type:complete len:82 (-) Transcript_5196:1593-1838(-)
MTDKASVYYMDKKNTFKYVNLAVQQEFDIETIPSKVYSCQGAFVKKLDYCVLSNRMALFTSPSCISIFPNLSNTSIDLVAT